MSGINHKSKKSVRTTLVAMTVCCLAAVLHSSPLSAQETGTAATPASDQAKEEIVTYSRAFFERYKPNTALDMVNRIPGFQVDDGANKRGFGSAVGNILINDRYPSAKQDAPSNILLRISADRVERIELIRSQVRDIDLLGNAVVANVILRENIPATTRWEVQIRKNFDHDPLTVRTDISISDQWGDLEYNAGIVFRKFASGEFGPETHTDSNGALFETRYEDSFLDGDEGNANLTAATWFGETLAKINAKWGYEDRVNEAVSIRVPESTGAVEREDLFVDTSNQRLYEIGADAERVLGTDLVGKAILLHSRDENETLDTERRFDESGAQIFFRVADGTLVETESIARLEFDWSRWTGHTIKMNLEGARNVIESALTQANEVGGAPEPVLGGNTRVEENRGDFLLSDTWAFGDYVFDYGLGAETSTVSQTGDFVQKRSFFFLKPHMAMTYSPAQRRQTRARLAREVSQLDFRDFVSTTEFQDNDYAFGNPNLKPESTWVAELSEERRFGELSVVKVTAYHHWISDVEDLLPFIPEFVPPDSDQLFEVPGNIGDGRRWGFSVEATAPLDSLGITGGRLDLLYHWRDSTVPDPVTFVDRVLSQENTASKPLVLGGDIRYAFGIGFRQDLEAARLAWGWDVRTRAERFLFKVNELDIRDEGTEINIFVETTRWLGLKIRFEGANLLDFEQTRQRIIYEGERELTPLDHQELQDRTDGRRILVTVSGSF